jgi:hypothetical protein
MIVRLSEFAPDNGNDEQNQDCDDGNSNDAVCRHSAHC